MKSKLTVCSLLLAACALPQEFRATLQGDVIDPSKSTIAGGRADAQKYANRRSSGPRKPTLRATTSSSMWFPASIL